jgi:hypothetical protein
MIIMTTAIAPATNDKTLIIEISVSCTLLVTLVESEVPPAALVPHWIASWVDKLESEQAAKDSLGMSIGDNSTETSINELNNLRIILTSSLRLYKVID